VTSLTIATAGITWQEPVAALIVLAAAAYLVWKVGWASRSRRRPRRGPDVPIARLRRAPRASDRKRE
jgi:hypothetical protein